MANDKVNPNVQDYSNKYDEETAAELTSAVYPVSGQEAYETINKFRFNSRVYGIASLAFAILSFFFYPYIAALIGIVLGFIAQRKGEITLGAWAIGICALSIILSLLVVPIPL